MAEACFCGGSVTSGPVVLATRSTRAVTKAQNTADFSVFKFILFLNQHCRAFYTIFFLTRKAYNYVTRKTLYAVRKELLRFYVDAKTLADRPFSGFKSLSTKYQNTLAGVSFNGGESGMVRDIAAQCLFHGFHSLTLTGMLPHAFQL